ncbi:tyrosine kinase receptor Cad96Ca [Cimex lectularius]|uniref:receptor protein-tyrosine kinase n=1 Tax=Cimex lectularius TaxID=79782 RepID=A0A8I6SE42_CIMLE|nr:tyrosine kinase receptor Cad96Ca [Cimex lectularius]
MDQPLFWTTVFLSAALTGGWSQMFDNAPPVLTVDRKWVIPDTEPVGTVVTKAKASDSDGEPLEYGIESHISFNVNFSTPKTIPFRIDSRTGVVYTNESLAGRGGEDLYLYVTVNDGKLTTKVAIWVSIVDSKNPGSGGSEDLPHGQVPLQLRPGGLPPRLPPPRTVLRPHVPQTPHPPPIDAIKITDPPSSFEPYTTETSKSVKPVTQPTPSSSTTLPPVVPSRPNMTDIAITVVPVAMVSIASALLVIAAFLFRKRMCSSKKKKTKEDMKKKSSTNTTTGEDPIVMQQWRGPRAFSNRYTAWDTDLSSPIPQQDAPSTPPIKVPDRWEYPRHHLKVFSILGEGCFGQVWKCEARDINGVDEGPKIVAVKTLKENAGERERSDLLSELMVMKMLEPHPNVVRLLGCCTDKDPIFVIMEYVANGKLQTYLRNSRATRSYDNIHGKSNSLTSRHLTSFCYQIARGMEYLTSRGIIHRDLAARNILVSADHTCKVADFGFARDVVASHVYERKSEGRLPIRWMAPESLYDNVFSVKSDAWSFGVLIWEIVTLGSTPYPGLSALGVMKRVKEGYRLEKPEHCRRELYNIMYYCWDKDPEARPDFKELVDLLDQLLLSETDYIELQRFPDHSYYNIASLSGEKV